ncbi:hypothetical protein B0J12DRAFT_729939 [Macrophomina phaseolina]|uniref:Zn(2)-C6 fungal-type domain-containing protein n=1 Tax=Macrophomina phaseolina TaxID=35725 RepID=A0ABQ8G569_9PEZI|nr:hypothetical protein B0J12DRAFT_729939 [Macrophomina phaseolina]
MPRAKEDRVGKERQSCESCYKSKVKCAADGPGPCVRCKDRGTACIRGVQKPLGRTPGVRNRRKKKMDTEERYPLTPESGTISTSGSESIASTPGTTYTGDTYTAGAHGRACNANLDFGDFLNPIVNRSDAFLDCGILSVTEVSQGSSATPESSSSISCSSAPSSTSSASTIATAGMDSAEPSPAAEQFQTPFSLDLCGVLPTGSADDLFDHLPCTCNENLIQAIDALGAAWQLDDTNNSNDRHPALDFLLISNKTSLGTITTFLDCLSIHDASLTLLVCHLLQKMLSLYRDAWYATTPQTAAPVTAVLPTEEALAISFGAYKLAGEDVQAVARQLICLDVAKMGRVLRRLEEREAVYAGHASSTSTLVPLLRRSLCQELRRLEDRLAK